MFSAASFALLVLSSPFTSAFSTLAFQGPATLGRPINPKITSLDESSFTTRISTINDAADSSIVTSLLRCAYTVEREKGQLSFDELTTRLFPGGLNSPVENFLKQARRIQRDVAAGNVVLAFDDSNALCAFGHMRSGDEEPEGVAVVRTYIPEKLKNKGLAGAAVIKAAEVWGSKECCSTIRLEIDKKRPSDAALIAFFIGGAGHLMGL